MKPVNDADITTVRAVCHRGDVLTFERVRQNRRTYYRLLTNGRAWGSLTDDFHAREAIAHWREKGWLL